MTGWISIGGQIVLTSAAAFSAGLQAQSLIIMNDDSYVPQRWQGMLFYWAILIYALVINIWGHRLLPMANLISGLYYSRLSRGGTKLIVPRGHSHSRLHRDSRCSRRYGP